ncbi:MAG: glycosyltransferase [Planctomycetia bacterium]|nr:glycosyltransferase [Planctomycetia bacterium]
MDYSIIIPAYNEEKFLDTTLNHVQEAVGSLSDRTGELIVVDNNSTDRTAEIAKNHGAKVCFEPINQISRARNAGGREAASPILIFLDADSLISPDLLRKTIDRMESGKYYGGGTQIDFDIPLNCLFRSFQWIWNTFSKRFRYAAGCYIYVLKEAFDEVNGFPEDHFAGEEIVFSRKLRKWGKSRKKIFSHIEDASILTSGRRLKEVSAFRILSTFFLLGFFPWLMKSREKCGIWYLKR